MTDVRLTALNPTDSQVYPVACNTSGELLVADGGGGTDYLPLTGGELTGPLTSTSSISAAGGAFTISSGGQTTNAQGFQSGGNPGAGIAGSTLGETGQINATAASNENVFTGRATGSSTPTVEISGSGNITAAGDAQIGAWDSAAANTQGAYIYSVGSFQVNRTSSGGSVFVGRLDGAVTSELRASGRATFAGTVMYSNGTDTSSQLTATGTVVERDTADAGKSVWRGYGGGVQTSIISSDGSATFTGTVTATVVPPSDARFKENITPAKPQLADVVALGGILKNYNWNTEAPVNDEIRAQRQLGLIAQEAAEICPSLVKELGSEENRYKGIPMEALIMKLIGAVSELKTELDQMKIT
jgi:hypothetical protein